MAFRRSLRGEKTVLCVANMGANDTPVVHGELLCDSGDVRGNGAGDAAGGSVVPPDTTAWFLVD